MRKSLYAFVALCTLAGYSLAEPVPSHRAQQLLQAWLDESPSRLNKDLGRSVRGMAPALPDEKGQPSCYIVQLDPEGFVVLSADDLIEPVIAFSSSGKTNDLVEGNPLWTLLREDLPARTREATGYASAAAASGPGKTSAGNGQVHQAKWNHYSKKAASASAGATAGTVEDSWGGTASVTDLRIAPLIQSRWNQSDANGQPCFNYYTPPGPAGSAENYYCGCVATAMAQLMRYWQHPTAGIGLQTRTIKVNGTNQSATTRGGNGLGGPYDWSSMPLLPNTDTYLLPHWQMIGALCYDAGVSVETSYSSGESSASMINMDTAFVNVFGYSNARDLYRSSGMTAATWERVLKSNLAGGHPVITGIRNSSTGSGHAVITDGYGLTSGTDYYHVNYGWGGSYDAWYNFPTLDSGSQSYNMVDALVYNIYTVGTGELMAGRVVNSLGGPIPGASVTTSNSGTTYTDTTDASGHFALKVPSARTYALVVSADNYPASTSSVSIGTSSTLSSGDTGNAWVGDITLAQNASVPTLGQWGLIGAFILLSLYAIRAQRSYREPKLPRHDLIDYL